MKGMILARMFVKLMSDNFIEKHVCQKLVIVKTVNLKKLENNMKLKYYVTSKTYNVIGDVLDVALCSSGSQVEWKRPEIQREWTEVLFDNELDALNYLRTLYADRPLTVLEDTGKVLSTFGHESGLTTIRIRREHNND
jgi:hypothetical protein